MENLDKSLRVLTYYHTSLRNIGLYTSLAFTAIIYSQSHKGKSFFINVSLIIASLILTTLSTVIGLFLIEDIKIISDNDEKMLPVIDKWLTIPNIMLFINAIVLISTLFVLFNKFS